MLLHPLTTTTDPQAMQPQVTLTKWLPIFPQQTLYRLHKHSTVPMR